MITLQGIRLNQRGYILYLTSTTVEELKSWFDADRIYPDIWKREKPEGYQRQPDKERFRRIAEYLERKLQIEETILPNTVILNIRQKGTIDFEPFEKSNSQKPIELGKILVYDEALPFYEVDGQHRVRGLIEAYRDLKEKQSKDFEEIRHYPIPLTIIEGLDRPEEAMQFVVINSMQRKVDPALVLRILHKRYRDKSEKLEIFLKGQPWRLYAVEICDQLNSDPSSPWCDKIIAPGDPRKGRVISEQNFVSSLEPIYSKLDIDTVKAFVPLYWRAISHLWAECTGDNATKYSLQRTGGIIAFHWLFPFVYFKGMSLDNVKLQGLITILKPVSKKFGPSFWKRGGEAKFYTSKASQAMLVDKMIGATLPGGKEFKLDKLDKSLQGTKEGKRWEIAQKLIPLRSYHLFKQDKVNAIDAGATGVYIFYSFTKQKFYVGRSEKADLKSRLQQHLQNKENEFHIFNYRLGTEPKEAHDLECALFHLVPRHLLMNKEHPSAFANRDCPFCSNQVTG
jgi:DGQHR domain-containing protein